MFLFIITDYYYYYYYYYYYWHIWIVCCKKYSTLVQEIRFLFVLFLGFTKLTLGIDFCDIV